MTASSDTGEAVALLAADPGLGCALRGAPGPARDAFLAALRAALPARMAWRKIPAGITEERLLGGLDLPATLAAGRPIVTRGALAEADGGVVVVAMAERLSRGVAAQIATVLDQDVVALERDGFSALLPARFGVVALDESATEGEAVPAALLDRLALWVDAANAPTQSVPPRGLAPIDVAVPADIVTALTVAAAALGIVSLRAPLLAVRAARAAAACAGRATATQQDAALAARLVLAPRATQLPAAEEEVPAEPPEIDRDGKAAAPADTLADRVVAAAAAALPADMLASLAGGPALRSKAGGAAGRARKQPTHGRPVGSRPGLPRGGARLHVLDTLRAAAPWQKLRVAAPGRIAVRREDFRIRKFRQKTRTTFIFVVDASGSAALARLAEAKGAVELLLAECYVRRDRAALFSVRGAAADLMLPPTSSLGRAKRLLAGLPGGGTTPLAAGIAGALALAGAIGREGQTPLAVFLTDGRANVALDGSQGRGKAEADAVAMAKAWRAAGHQAVFIDTSARPHQFARQLADAAAARYVALPHAHAGAVRDAVQRAVVS